MCICTKGDFSEEEMAVGQKSVSVNLLRGGCVVLCLFVLVCFLFFSLQD